MKTTCVMIISAATLAAACTALAVVQDFPTATGDIAITGTGGWTTMPGTADTARFSKFLGGTYTASGDVAFGSILVSKSTTFNLKGGGNHTVKLANFSVAVANMTAAVNGGVWDISSLTSGTQNQEVGAFAACNMYADAARTKIVLADGCVVTNASFFVVSNGGAGNEIDITDGSRVYAGNVYIGGRLSGAYGNTLVLRGASLSCDQFSMSRHDNSGSNSFYIVGADSCFTARVTNLPRYPFVNKGAWNTFEMDGAEWNYWLNMATDDNASSNTIRFVNGARMNMVGGLFTGTNHINSCGNRVYVGSGSQMNLAFVYFSRADNVLTVSNATVSATGNTGTYNGNIKIGNRLLNVDLQNISGNGLVLQGNVPSVSADRVVSFENGSFLRFEIPENGYAANHIPLNAASLTLDNTSDLEVRLPVPRGNTENLTLVSTVNGIAIPAVKLDAVNASLAAQSGGMAKLALANGNKDLVLKVARGMNVSIR